MSTLFSDDAIARLNAAQAMRLELLDTVIGEKLPDETNLEKASFILGALKDVESVELNIARIRAQQQQTDSISANAAIMAQLMMQTQTRQRVTIHGDANVTLPDEVEIDLIDGEADLDYRAISYDELTASPE